MPNATLGASRAADDDRTGRFLESLVARGQAIELLHGRILGEGGMGIVREAEQVALARIVAVKTLKPGRSGTGDTEALLHEAWVMGALEHPNIVPVHHLEADAAGNPLMILKRIAGVEWSSLIAAPAEIEHRFGARDALAWNLGILDQVLNALRFAHSCGVIHRDLKPSNVMIGHFGEVYLLDWGLAVSLDPDETGRLALAVDATEIAGTPGYMAPEMLGGHVPTVWTDVYLAGAVLYELLAGHPPHVGTDATAILSSIALSQPQLPAEAPPELAQICIRAMQADPADRFPSVAALQRALAGYLEHRNSAQIAMRASAHVELLLAALGDASVGPARQREDVYRYYVVCRFAFHEALAAWPGNSDARDGLARATVAVAQYEFGAGDARAAVALLHGIEVPTVASASLLVTAQAAVETELAHQHALEQLRQDHDPQTDTRSRWLLGGVFGLVFSIVPLMDVVLPAKVVSRSPLQEAGWAGMMCAIVLVIGWRWRARAQTTAINRRTFSAGAFLFLAQGILVAGAWALDLPMLEVRVFMLFLWGVIIGTVAITLDRSLAISAGIYLTAFLVGAHDPALTPYLMAATNLAFAVNILWRWRPRVP
jgi:hypothetical protein